MITSSAAKQTSVSLFRAVMNVNILEGVRFYVSFACTFGFGENKVMEGSAKILSLIARDENQHLVITQNIINKWASGSEGAEWKQIYERRLRTPPQMFETCVNDEKAWAKYLFKDGSMIGLSEPLLARYVEWIANRRMKAIGLETLYDVPAKNNPLPWTDNWLKSKGVQNAPQERRSSPTSSVASSKTSRKTLSTDSNCKYSVYKVSRMLSNQSDPPFVLVLRICDMIWASINTKQEACEYKKGDRIHFSMR